MQCTFDLQELIGWISVGPMLPNLFTNLPADLPEELFTTLLQTPGLRIERIVSHGHQCPDGFWYDQPIGEWVIVLKGGRQDRVRDQDSRTGPRRLPRHPGPYETPGSLDNAR